MTDEIPLPEPYEAALSAAVTSFIIMRFLSFRASDDASYLAMADRILDGLDGLQVNIPTEITDTTTMMEAGIKRTTSSATGGMQVLSPGTTSINRVF
jgi:hypothetical protein